MKLSLIGTGYMGAPMAEKLLEAGNELGVFNRTFEKAQPLADKGAEVFKELKDAVDFSDVMLFILSDYHAIESLLNSINHDSLKGKTIIQMSTIAPNESIKLLERFEEIGSDYFEAPVLGSIPQIKSKSLIVLVGSNETMYNKYKDVFAAFSDDIRHIGKIGEASSIKLALNQLIVGVTSVFAMSLGFVRERNLNVEAFMEIVRKSALYAPTYDKKLDNYISRDFSNPNFPLKHLLKDLNLMIDAFSSEHINVETLKGIQKVLNEGIDSGLGELDYSALYNVIHRENK